VVNEDKTTFTSVLTPAAMARASLRYSLPGMVNAWARLEISRKADRKSRNPIGESVERSSLNEYGECE
jgi:hypothetical protein